MFALLDDQFWLVYLFILFQDNRKPIDAINIFNIYYTFFGHTKCWLLNSNSYIWVSKHAS